MTLPTSIVGCIRHFCHYGDLPANLSIAFPLGEANSVPQDQDVAPAVAESSMLVWASVQAGLGNVSRLASQGCQPLSWAASISKLKLDFSGQG